MSSYLWHGEVRTHEIDVQGIMNNAHYLHYFDHVRTLHLLEKGINWVTLSQNGLDIVLVETHLHFLKPLKAFDSFQVSSEVKPQGRIKLIFNQEIICNGITMCSGTSTVVCIDRKRNKPIPMQEIVSPIYTHSS